MRLYGLPGHAVETVVRTRSGKGLDGRGNHVYRGFILGRLIVVVMAADNPNYVITVFPKEGR